MMNTEPITIELEDLTDAMILALLDMLRMDLPAMLEAPDGGQRSANLLAAGMAVAGEAFRRNILPRTTGGDRA